jgi:uncharacterized membrane protein YeaQ/YmgE (transglycosylase-associated protein family)
MSILEVIILLVVAAIAGIVSQKITNVQTGGLVMSIILGFVGAWLGRTLSNALTIGDPIHINVVGHSFPVLWTLTGAALANLIVGWIQARGRRKKAEKK